MTKSLQLAMAALFQRHGQAIIRPEEAKLILCYQLRWCKPKEAEALLERAVTAGLLKPKERNFELSFDYQGVTVPEGFQFDPAVLTQLDEELSVFDQILNRLSKPGEDRRRLLKRLNNSQRENGLTDIELEGLLLALERGGVIDDLLPPLYVLLKQRYNP